MLLVEGKGGFLSIKKLILRVVFFRYVSLSINGAFRDRTMAYIVSPEGLTAVSEHRTTQQLTKCDWKKIFLNVLSQDFNMKKVSV